MKLRYDPNQRKDGHCKCQWTLPMEADNIAESQFQAFTYFKCPHCGSVWKKERGGEFVLAHDTGAVPV